MLSHFGREQLEFVVFPSDANFAVFYLIALVPVTDVFFRPTKEDPLAFFFGVCLGSSEDLQLSNCQHLALNRKEWY